MTGPTHPIRALDLQECLTLLETDDIGRLAVVQGDAPAIFPVTYVLDGDSIVFRTAPGTKVDYGPRALAAFEIDHLDREDHTGWSVVALGRLEVLGRVDDPHVPEHVRRLPVTPWAEGDRPILMRLVPGTITGRLIGDPPPDA